MDQDNIDGFDDFDDQELDNQLVALTGPPPDKDMMLQGENSILRSKIESINRTHDKEIKGIHDRFQQALKKQETNMGALNEQIESLKNDIVRLEDEKKFLKNEKQSLHQEYLNSKKRKISSTQSVDNTTDLSSTQIGNPSTTIIHYLPVLPNEKSLFLEHVTNLSISGLNYCTLDILEKFSHVAPQKTLKDFILGSLINCNLERLDELVSFYLQLLLDVLNTQDEPIVISLILSLINSGISYRPAALKGQLDVVEQVCDKILHYIGVFKKYTKLVELFEPVYTNLQDEYLKKLVVVYAMDTLVTISRVFEFHGLKKDIIERLDRFPVSTQTPVKLLINYLDILETISSEARIGTYLVPFVRLLNVQMDSIKSYNMYGLNDQLGNNNDVQLLKTILFGLPQALSPISLSTFEQLTNYDSDGQFISRFNMNVLQFKLKALKLMQKAQFQLQSNDMIPELCKLIGIQQNYITRFPRCRSNHLRLKLINVMIETIHTRVYDQTSNLPDAISTLPSEVLADLIVVLAKITFSKIPNLHTSFCEFGHDLRLKKRNRVPLIQDFKETNPTQLYYLEIETSNGLEVPYDDKTIELSKDILGKYVTSEDADELYDSILNPSFRPGQDHV
ncbi:hypothetical protein LJB42_000118 [Komagataella kurtzmanii]|nr:hypothetical protein LJB42_000118 [Komagataella kurtzmanii]